MDVDKTINHALENGQGSLSEYTAKKILQAFGIPVTREMRCPDAAQAVQAAESIAGPVVLKPCSADILHKSETGCIHLNLTDPGDIEKAGGRIQQQLGKIDILVQEMIPGSREIVAGLVRDAQFGPCVMLGMGGVLTEVIDDTVFRAAPFDEKEAVDMISQMRSQKIFASFRGEAPVDIDSLCKILKAVGQIGVAYPAINEIDINPLKIRPDGMPVAVDALMLLSSGA